MRFLHLFEISIPFQCACLCLPMCTNLYAYEYLPIFAYKCVPTYMPLSTYLYLPTYVYLPMCTCKCVPTNVYLPVCTYQCVLTSVYLPMCASVFHECLIRPRSCIKFFCDSSSNVLQMKRDCKEEIRFVVDIDISLILNSDTLIRIQKEQSLLTRSIILFLEY